jgi:hypothetical protein
LFYVIVIMKMECDRELPAFMFVAPTYRLSYPTYIS